MKKLLLLVFLSFIIASQAMFGQKYCQNENIYLFNLPGASWNVSAFPPFPSNGQIIYMNTNVYSISHNGVTVQVSSQNFRPDDYFGNIVFNGSNEASFCITCVQMLEWQYNGAWSQIPGAFTSGPVCITIKRKPSIIALAGTQACSNVGLIVSLDGTQSGINYSLYKDNSATGSVVVGTGGYVSFPNQTIPGTYTVTATNPNNSCSAAMSGSDIVNPVPTVNSITSTGSAPYSTSVGTTIGLNASQTGVNYQLYNNGVASGSSVGGTTGSAISFGLKNTDGTYIVIATNASTACSSNMSGSVIIYTPPTIYNITGNTPTCTITGSTIGLNGSYPNVSYQLFNGATADGAPLAGTGNPLNYQLKTIAGTYTIVATDGHNLSSTMTGSITINQTPTVTLDDFTPVCLNNPTFALKGGTPLSGTYSGTGVTGNNFNPSLAGVSTPTITYTYTLNGCSSSAAKTLTVKSVPSVTTTPIPAVCINAAPVSLTPYFSATPAGGSATYAWPNGSGSNLNPTSVGKGDNKIITYTYTAANGCVGSATNTINIIDLPPVTLDNFQDICKDANAFTLTGGSPTGGNYSAASGVNNGVYTPSGTAGTQTITYTYTDSKTGCVNSANKVLTILDAVKPAWPEFVNFPDSVMCKGTDQTLALKNGDAYTIQWFTGSTSIGTDKSYKITGITQNVPLTIKYTDGHKCVNDRSLNIKVDNIRADFSAPTAVKVGSAVTFTDLSVNAKKWLWTMGTEGPSVSQSPVFYFNIVGTKTIKLVTTSSNNCKDSITRTNYITVTATGVNDVKSAGSDLVVVYPNPFTDFINVDLTDKNEDAVISIINMSGTKVIEKEFSKANGVVTINTNRLPAGTYLMVLTIEGKTNTVKLEKR